MAADVVALLDFVGWTNDREVHVVGISLGGSLVPSLSTGLYKSITRDRSVESLVQSVKNLSCKCDLCDRSLTNR